jgi:transcription initiation factor TFIID subunit 13
MKRKPLFAKDVKGLMYGFGDCPDPLPESILIVDELLESFIVDLCEKASKHSTGDWF